MSLVSYKIDLHTHSILSYDGGISERDYTEVLQGKKLDYIAITDHNTIKYALYCRKKLGDAIIVGEEIQTKQGDLIGLFLEKAIPPFLSFEETIQEIKKQHGIVYLPHPFDLWRKSSNNYTDTIFSKIDILESFNARMVFAKANTKAYSLAKAQKLIHVSASDSHSRDGLGVTYTLVNQKISRKNLLAALASAQYKNTYLPFTAYLTPTYNKIKHYVFS